MDTSTIKMEDYLSAISRLFILSSNKRHQLKDFKLNFSDRVGILAQEINNEICNKIKIDIFKSQLIESIILYERELNFLFTKYTSENIIEDKELEDELFLLKSYTLVDNTYFQDNNFNINTKFQKEVEQKFSVTIPTIIVAAKKPNYLHRIVDIENGDNFFATAIEKNVILIYHLVVNRDNNKMIDIQTVLTFNIAKYKDMISNPTRLFLNVLDDYGIDITIDNETRRFFKYVKILNKNVQGNMNLMQVSEIGNDSIRMNANFMKTEYGAIVKYAYGINYTRYLKK